MPNTVIILGTLSPEQISQLADAAEKLAGAAQLIDSLSADDDNEATYAAAVAILTSASANLGRVIDDNLIEEDVPDDEGSTPPFREA